MITVRPFKALRPLNSMVSKVMAPPYDVLDRNEAYGLAKGNPVSFLHVTRAEIDFPENVDPYSEKIYERGRDNLYRFIDEGVMFQEEIPCFYLYRQEALGRVQEGIVCTVSVNEYIDGKIKKHELTRVEKEEDRLKHFVTCSAHTEPVFLMYRGNDDIHKVIREVKERSDCQYSVAASDKSVQKLYRISEEAEISKVMELFKEVDALYIADGHHRCSSAARVGMGKDIKENDERKYFLAVVFSEDQLKVYPYNRLVRDLNGLREDEFLKKVEEAGFSVTFKGSERVTPLEKHTFGMLVKDRWYLLKASKELLSEDIVENLDVSILQKRLLSPILGIEDPRTDKRIDFLGGIKDLSQLERRCSEDMSLAFSMFPVKAKDILEVSDKGMIMPPKSTWFEPKLQSGLFLHLF